MSQSTPRPDAELLQPPQSSPRWWQGLDRYCWVVLLIAALGWLFDTMDQNIFNLVRKPSVADLLRGQYGSDPKAFDAHVKQIGGILTSVFLVGWAVGGFLFGVIGDRLGRAKTMIVTILVYALFTGLSGVATNWYVYALFRFMTALGVGGEFAAGAALVAETFPARSRPMALGTLQALSAVGNMMASVITLVISLSSAGTGGLETHWRWAYFVGAAPALLVFWIAKDVHEPEVWKQAKAQARAATAGADGKLNRELGGIGQLFAHPTLRRNTIAGVLLATAGVGGLWGVAFFSPEMVSGELTRGGLSKGQIGSYTSVVYLVQQLGAFLGAMAFAAFTEKTSRRLAFTLGFALSWASVLAYFWGIQGAGADAFWRAMILAPIMGFCTLGPFSGYSIYFPELFPTRLRATGCGFCYNAARILAAGAPFALGSLGSALGGYAPAATVVTCIYLLGFVGAWIGPETRGRALPEDADFEGARPDPVGAAPAA